MAGTAIGVRVVALLGLAKAGRVVEIPEGRGVGRGIAEGADPGLGTGECWAIPVLTLGFKLSFSACRAAVAGTGVRTTGWRAMPLFSTARIIFSLVEIS